MTELYGDLPHRFHKLGKSQDAIGWRRFMEGMIFKEIVVIQRAHTTMVGAKLGIEVWSRGLITKLLETTHGQ